MGELVNGCWIKHAKWTGSAVAFILGAIVVILLAVTNGMSENTRIAEAKLTQLVLAQDERIRENEKARASMQATLTAIKEMVTDINRKLNK